MTGVQWVGVYTIVAAGGCGLVFLLVAWGTRTERRAQTERRVPRCVVRATDWIDSYHQDGQL